MNTSIDTIIALSSNGTEVHSHPEAHPHRLDIAAEVIGKMTIPTVPIDPSDRSQTRHAETIDLGREIGINHLVEVSPEDEVIHVYRGDRAWDTPMVFKPGTPETRACAVCFWADEKWILWTLFEGADGEGLPEPGCDRYKNGTPEFQKACDEYWETHAIAIDVPIFRSVFWFGGDFWEKFYTDENRAREENKRDTLHLMKRFGEDIESWVEPFPKYNDLTDDHRKEKYENMAD